MNKTCTKCNTIKEYSEFRIDKSKSDGYYSSCKACCKLIESTRYTTNRIEIRANRKLAYDDVARSKKAEYDKQYREDMGEVRLKQKRDYYHTTGKAVGEKWRKLNLTLVLAYSKQARAKRMLLLSATTITPSEMSEWLVAEPKVCAYCSTSIPNKYEVDHIEPLSKGGEHSLTNLAIACRSCNASKSNKQLLLWYATNRSER